jgi:hypothetical protein
MALKADRDGFLIGERPEGEESPEEKWLASIKGDTSAMLALLKAGARAARATAAPAGRSAAASRVQASAMPAAARSVAAPGPRSTLARDPATGRFVSAPRPSAEKAREQRAVQAASQTAEAVAAMARTDEARRRDEKAAERAAGQTRGADGRFGSDGAGGRGGSGGGFGVAGGAIGDVQQVDPLLGAASEIGGMVSTAKAVVEPLGRVFPSMGGGEEGGGRGGWLRKVWRELRLMRRDDAAQSRTEVRKLGDVAKAAGRGGGGGGGGFLSMLMGAAGAGGFGGILGRIAAMIVPAIGAVFMRGFGIVGAALAGWKIGSWIYEKFAEPIQDGIAAMVSGWDKAVTFVQEKWTAATQFVSDVFEPARKLFGDLYEWAGSLPGMGKVREIAVKAAGAVVDIGGRALDTTRGMASAAAETVKSYADRAMGWVSKKFESGKGGAGTVSTGKGDFGGKSYGTHQLASNTGTLQKFLASSPYGAQFAGMTPGSPEFDAKWKQLAATDKGFAGAQHDFIKRSHFDPQMARLKKGGIDLSGRGEAVQEAIFSTSTQFGAQTGLVQRALAGKDVAGMSDAQIVAAIQDHKIANNARLFRSSDDKTRSGTLARAHREKALLMGLATSGAAEAPRIASMPAVPSPPVAPAVPQMPSSASAGPQRLSSAPAPAPAAPPAVITQDVPDRTIAHILTGGIGAGGGYAHR